MRSAICVVGVLAVTSLGACVIVRSVSVEETSPAAARGTTVDSPLKAFLAGGQIAVFPDGALVDDDEIVGTGSLYGVGLVDTTEIQSLSLDSVVGLEAFDRSVNAPATFLASIGTTALVTLGTIGIACAADPKCFGSCPTIYAWEDGEEILEAEAFSYSIAPLLEGRDVDRLGVQADERGRVRLELRNEALETHYINHVELLQVDHPHDRTVFVDGDGQPLTVGSLHPPLSVVDRDGASLLDAVAVRDGVASRSSAGRLEAVTADDFGDHLVLRFPAVESDSLALVLRLRNSLLNSVLFYDMMLGAQGAEALNWIGRDIQRIGPAVELGRWFHETMGLRIDVRGPSGWEEVTRVADSGPIAWKDLAIPLPVTGQAMSEVRLRFLTDQWRIDHVALAEDARGVEPAILPLHSITPLGGDADATLRDLLAEPDDEYLVTTAAAAFTLEFQAKETSLQRTFLLSSQGYYTEWVRPEWIRSATSTRPFRPGEKTVVELVERWVEVKEDFETRFFSTRIPVR